VSLEDRVLSGSSAAFLHGSTTYDEAWPLPQGWRARLQLYELYHVLNHYNLFGGGYGAQAFAMVRKLTR